MTRALVVLAAGLAASAAFAQGAPALQPCRPEDVVGLWVAVRLGVAPLARVDRSEAAYQAHQMYVFHGNGTMAHVGSATYISRADRRALVRTPATTTWTLDPPGRLLRRAPGAATAQAATCEVIVQEVHDPRSRVAGEPGDLLITELGEGDAPVSRRQLRKITLEE